MSAMLHLVPGFVAFLSYLYLFARLSAALGFPRQMAFVWMDVFVLIPLLLGSLFYFGHAKSGRWTIDGIVLNRKHLVGPAFGYDTPGTIRLLRSRDGCFLMDSSGSGAARVLLAS